MRATALLAMLAIGLASPARAADAPMVAQILKDTGVSVGLAVVVGTTDGKFEAELAAEAKILVQGLAADPRVCRQAQATIATSGSAGLAGVVAVESFRALPYPDSLANLVVCDLDALDAAAPAREELLRIMAPTGCAYLRVGGRWQTARKPFAAGMDEWTNYLHGGGVPRTSRDQTLSLPLELRWVDGPTFGNTPARSDTLTMVSSGGRLFMLTSMVEENAGLSIYQRGAFQWITARDAFNGLRLWKRPFVAKKTGLLRGTGATPTYPFALLAVRGDRVYTFDDQGAPVIVDAATGKDLRTLATKSPRREFGTLLAQPGVVLIQVEAGWEAFGESDGKPLWTLDIADQFHLADDRALHLLSAENLTRVDLATGKKLWSVAVPPPLLDERQRAGPRRIEASTESAVIVMLNKELVGFAAADGKRLWSIPAADSRQFGAVWQGAFAFGGKRYSLSSGEEVGTAPPIRNGNCSPPLVTPRFTIEGRSHIYTDAAQGFDYRALRISCGANAIAANGMIYAIPSDCMCSRTHARGFAAHGSAPAAPAADFAAARPVVRGEAAAPAAQPSAATSAEWPTYRQNLRRSAGLVCQPVRRPRLLWSAEVAKPLPAEPLWQQRAAGQVRGLSAPTVAEGAVFVADGDRYRLVALDARSGAVRWTFATPSAVDSPPTIAAGLAVFGCRDGWVYCLRADDGRLVWRARAAPAEQFIPAYGHLESRWPAIGSVTVVDDVVYATAGRSVSCDGGIAICAFALADGRTLWARAVTDCSRWGSPFNDVAVSDGRSLWFVGETLSKEPPAAPKPAQKSAKHAQQTADILVAAIEGLVHHTRLSHESRYHTADWICSTYGGVRGRALAWHDQRVFGFTRWTRSMVNGSTSTEKFPANFFMAKADTIAPPAPIYGKEELAGPPNAWIRQLPARTRGAACIVTGEVAVAAFSELVDGKYVGRLQTLELGGGQPLSTIDLDVLPRYDGLAAVDGKLFLVCEDGRVCCFAE